jgi:hypothetical protein
MRRIATVAITGAALVAGLGATATAHASTNDKGELGYSRAATPAATGNASAQSRWKKWDSRRIKHGVRGTWSEGYVRYAKYKGRTIREITFRTHDSRGGLYGGVQIRFRHKIKGHWRVDTANSGTWAVRSNGGGVTRYYRLSSYYYGEVCTREVAANGPYRNSKIVRVGHWGCWK